MISKIKKESLKTRARVIKAMANETRLFIVEELAKEKKSVSELTDMIGTDISTISRHLLILRNAGIVSDERKGNRIYYSLKTPCILNFFSCVENVLKEKRK